MNYYNYSGIPLSAEVREFLAENDKEWKRQKDRIYQYGVSNHAFDVEERSPGNPGGATCDPIYAVTRAQKLSAEKAFFRQEARKALNAALLELSASGRRRLFLHFYDELSYSEIARRENVSESAVRGQIKASLLQLRRVLVDLASAERQIPTFWMICSWPNAYTLSSIRGLQHEKIYIAATKEQCLDHLANDQSRPDKEAWKTVIEDWFLQYGKYPERWTESEVKII